MTARVATAFAAHDPTRRIRRLIVAVAVFLFLGALLSGFYRLQQNLDTEYRRVGEAAAYTAASLDHELDLRRKYVEMVADQAGELLNGRYTPDLQLVRGLRPTPDGVAYTLDVPPGFTASEFGFLMGMGPVPTIDSGLAREMAMAIGLTPLFKVLKRHDRHLPWVYYRSARGFVYFYPSPESETGRRYFYNRDDERKPIYADALPLANPQHKLFWTPVYDDANGKGKVVTLSKPLYERDQFRGVVSLDIALRTLLDTIRVRSIPHSTIGLADRAGRNPLDPDAEPLPAEVLQASPGQFRRSGDATYLIYPLKAADWSLVVRTDHRAMLWAAFSATLLLVGAIVMSLLSMVLLVLLAGAMRHMQSMSIQDGLTGLFNRRHFDEIAKREFAHSRRNGQWLGLAILDVDFFKKYNDHYGHPSGDTVLRGVADALQATLKRATDGVFRVGGEEFAVLVQLDDPARMPDLAEHICDAVRALAIPHAQSNWGLVTVSLGAVVVGPGSRFDLEAAYRAADEALYRAKQGGRNRGVVDGEAASGADAP
ncbi:sensor domain-containing diguanylate cyclase [Chitiniphilus shinanonensis]|uniref:diguanylate cyclase n=1 Tax=Chitiniphilus shinanonensis TaxID=553088 RepID=A0ABQ6BXK4_9NEIS|nr:sensor domain-containing diguanylate cyclase [Chitiniphilus shinanonensis]GLS06046.1 sensor domain-containing diguanylate cyclase [Chitiniphilus shinanonensis]